MTPLGDLWPAGAGLLEGEEDNDAAAEGEAELKDEDVANVAWLGCDVEGVPVPDLRARLRVESTLS